MRTCSILVVEDHADTAALLARLLRRLGHEVATASCASEALTLAVARPFQIVISDVGLPDGDGCDLFRAIRAVRPTVRGVAVTGYGLGDDVTDCRVAGFDAHLVKPVDFAALTAALDAICEPTEVA